MSTSRSVATALALVLCVPAISLADSTARCNVGILKGQYVFTASGFTRPPGSGHGTAWVPKAIVEVLQFNGDGTMSTTYVTVDNPFGDTGGIPVVALARARLVDVAVVSRRRQRLLRWLRRVAARRRRC